MTYPTAKYPSFNNSTGTIMPTGIDLQKLALEVSQLLQDAPSDGQSYVRCNGEWVPVSVPAAKKKAEETA